MSRMEPSRRATWGLSRNNSSSVLLCDLGVAKFYMALGVDFTPLVLGDLELCSSTAAALLLLFLIGFVTAEGSGLKVDVVKTLIDSAADDFSMLFFLPLS